MIREARVLTTDNLFISVCDFIEYARLWIKQFPDYCDKKRQKHCLLMKTTHAVVYMCIFVSQYSNAVWFSLTKTKMVKNEKIMNSSTKTKTKTKNDENIENDWKRKRKCQNSKTCHSTKVRAFNTTLTGATAIQRWIRDYRWTVFRQIINTSSSAGLIKLERNYNEKTIGKTKTKTKTKNKSKRKSHWFTVIVYRFWLQKQSKFETVRLIDTWFLTCLLYTSDAADE